MKNIKRIFRIPLLALTLAVFVNGCASSGKSSSDLSKTKSNPKSGNVQSQTNQSDAQKTQEEIAAEIKRLENELRQKVKLLVEQGKYDAARDVVLKLYKGSCDQVTQELTKYRKELLYEYINTTCYTKTVKAMENGVAERIAKGDFYGARAFVAGIPFARKYATPIDESLDLVRGELAKIGITEEQDKEGFDNAIALLEEFFRKVGKDCKSENIVVKEGWKPNVKGYESQLNALRNVLTAHECTGTKQDEIIGSITQVVEKLIQEMIVKPEYKKNITMTSLGTTTYNEILAQMKEEIITNEISPKHLKVICDDIEANATKLLESHSYTEARDYVLSHEIGAPADLTEKLNNFRTTFVNEKINPAHLQYVIDTLPKDVKEIVARNDFAGARDYLRKMTEIRVYSAELEACLKDIETELLKLGLDELDVKTMTKQVRESLLNEFFADDSVTPNILHAGDEFSPDTTTINNLLGTFKERLSTFGCSQEQCDSVIATLSEKAMPLLDGKKVPVQDTELPVPLALGTSELKRRFDKLINDLAHDLIVVPEIQFHITTMTDTTNEKVAKNEYKEAHIFLKKYPVTGFKEIDDRIEETRTRLDTLLVTPAELQYHIQAINASIKGYCEKQAFAEARMALKEYPLTGIEKTDVVLEATKQKLLDDIIRPHEIVFRKAELTKAAMEALANNDYLGARLTIGNYTLTDDAVVAQEITALKQELLDKKVTPSEIKYTTGLLTTKVNELVAQNLFDDAREYIMTFTYLSEPEINKVVDDTKQSLVNDVINPAHVLFCIDAMQKTVREILPTGDFDKARMYVEDYPLVGIAAVNEGIKIGKENTILNVINPAHIAARVKELRTNVYAALDTKNLDAARKAIKDFGVCGIKEVDAVVFAVKCGLLNVRVNVETLKAIRADYTKQMADALAAKNFAKAKKIIEDIQRIPAYSEIIDENLDAAMDAAMEVGAGPASAQEVINETKEYLYSLIAYRRGNYEGEDIDVNREKKANWTIIKEYLQIVQNKLIDDDMAVEDAKALVDYVLTGFMESKRVQDKQGVEQDCLTTAELNDEIERLRTALRGDFTAALAAQAEADKAAAGEAARKVAEQVANEALASIDIEGSISALQAEVTKSSDKVLTQILAEGVRVLRLMSLDRKSVTPSNATSLLAAAAYAGYDEVMNLAVMSGANINGYSVKDPLKRSPLLMSIEGGMKGHPMSVLTKANLNCLDTKGRGTVYYAVKYNNPKFLADLLRQKAASQLGDEKGITPLMLAAANGNANMVTALIPFSNINEKDKEGNTAFLWAAKSASLKAVKALASAKADVKIVNAAGLGAVELAAFNEGTIDLLGYLMNELELRPAENQIIAMIRGGNIGAMNRMAKFAKASFANEIFLLEAINGNNAAMVKLLVAQGCDLHTDNVGNALKALKERIKALDVDTKTEIDVATLTAKVREILEENGITDLNCNEAQKLLCEKLLGLDVSEILKKHGIIDLNSQEAQQQVCAKAIELSEKRKAEERQQFAELVEFLGHQGIDMDLI